MALNFWEPMTPQSQRLLKNWSTQAPKTGLTIYESALEAAKFVHFTIRRFISLALEPLQCLSGQRDRECHVPRRSRIARSSMVQAPRN